MAKVVDVGMERGDLKRLLGVAKSDPVSCAVGLDADGATALIMMHKTKGPKAVAKEMDEKFPDAKLVRWGTISIDKDEGVVKVIVNKAAGGGLARKLTKSLKGTGYNKVELMLEDGSSLEKAADEEEAQESETVAAPTAQAQESTTEKEPDADEAEIAAIDKELRGHIGKIATAAAGEPAKLGSLKAAAGEAVAAIKAKDVDKAKESVAKLKDLLEAKASSTEAAGAPMPSFVTMQKSRLLWDGARKKVASEIVSLKKDVLDYFDGDPEAAQVMDALDQLDELTENLNEELLDALDDLLNEQDPAKHAALLKEAKSILADYSKFVSSSPLVQGLSGDTPFGTKLSIGTTYSTVIKALEANLR